MIHSFSFLDDSFDTLKLLDQFSLVPLMSSRISSGRSFVFLPGVVFARLGSDLRLRILRVEETCQLLA